MSTELACGADIIAMGAGGAVWGGFCAAPGRGNIRRTSATEVATDLVTDDDKDSTEQREALVIGAGSVSET